MASERPRRALRFAIKDLGARARMAIACLLGRHAVVQAGVRNGAYEFARCDRCRCDLMRMEGQSWMRVPNGYKIVWKPRTDGSGGIAATGSAAFAREVDLRGVTVVGERTMGAQRFALVILNARDERDYGGMVDPLGMDGPVAARIAGTSRKPTERTATLYDLLSEPAKSARSG